MNNRKALLTRRIHIGWKHSFKGNSYQHVTESKGGGKYQLDVDKGATLDELKRMITDKYFPSGRNETLSLNLSDLKSFLATFTGYRLTERLKNGNLFIFGDFLEEYNSSPVRIYLHTKFQDLWTKGNWCCG